MALRNPISLKLLSVAVAWLALSLLASMVSAQEFDACELLKDPASRAKISAALERKLAIRCGVVTPQTLEELLSTVRDDREPLVPDRAAPGGDIQINNPATDIGGTTQSETSIVAVGETICAAYNDSGSDVFNVGFSGFSYSLNGGTTWTDGGAFPAGPGPDHHYGDPSLAWSDRDGVFYYAALSDLGLSIWSSAGCTAFNYIGPIHVGFGDDKELMAVDNNPVSSFYGRIYVGWTDFAAPFDLNVVSFSDDGGVTWSAPVHLPGSGYNGQGMWPAVAPNGDVFFALVNRCFSLGCSQDQWVYKSTNGGVSFALVAAFTGQLVPENTANTISCGRQALTGDIRNLSSPQIAIHPDAGAPAGYVIHITYPYDSDGAGADNSNVFYRRSTNGGTTWTEEVQLNTDSTTTDQWFPALGVNAAGDVAVSWYDRRLDTANNSSFDRYEVISNDGGITWGPNIRVSDVSSPVAQTNPNFDTLIVDCYHGDYDQVFVGNNWIHMIWSDDRNITGTGPNPDVFYDRDPVIPPPPDHACCNTGEPGCIDPAIEAAVCAADSYCCSVSWDSLCVREVAEVAGDNCNCCFQSPEAEGCFEPAVGNAVSDCVCASDSYCCEFIWDGICVEEVEGLGCGVCEPALAMVVDNTTSTATVFDSNQDLAIGSVAITPGLASGDCSITADQSQGFVTNFLSEVWVIDPLAVAPAAAPNPIPISNEGEDTSLTADGQFLVVCDGSLVQPVSVIDTVTQTEVSSFPLGTDCNSVEVCSDGSVLVTSWTAQQVRRLMIDGAGNLTDTGDLLAVGDPNNVLCSPDAHSGVVITANTDQIHSFTIPGLALVDTRDLSGTFGLSGVIDGSRGRVYTRDNGFPGFVEVFDFDTVTGALGAAPLLSIPIADDPGAFFGMDQMALHPDGSRLYVSQPNGVDIFDPDSGANLGSILSPNIVAPTGVCFPGVAGPPCMPVTTLTVSSVTSIPPGVSGDVTVKTTNGLTVGSTDVTVNFDPSQLQAVSCSSSKLSSFTYFIDNMAGTVATASASASGDTLNPGDTLFTCTFQGVGIPPGCTTAITLSDADGDTCDDLAGPVPPIPPEPLPYLQEPGGIGGPVPGDVDCDGSLTPIDASVILGLFVGSVVDSDLPPPCDDPAHRLKVSDWLLDGSLDPIDASITLAIFVGIIDECGTPLGQSIPCLCPPVTGAAIKSSVASAAPPQQASLWVGHAVAARAGGTAIVPVTTRTALDVASTGLSLAYDADALEVLSVESELEGFTYHVDGDGGVIRAASAGLGQRLETGDALLRVTFQLRAGAERGRYPVAIVGETVIGGSVVDGLMPSAANVLTRPGWVRAR